MSFRATTETNDTKFAATMSVPRQRKRRAGQTRPQGRNGYGAWHETIMEGGRSIDRSYKKENR